jgi:DNA-binding CsgD family transcriptional regulator
MHPSPSSSAYGLHLPSDVVQVRVPSTVLSGPSTVTLTLDLSAWHRSISPVEVGGELLALPIMLVVEPDKTRGASVPTPSSLPEEIPVASVAGSQSACRLRDTQVGSLANIQARYATLTRREREVMTLVSAGLMNKQIGAALGVQEITVKIHRGKVMRKMQASSLPDLVRMADRVDNQRHGHDWHSVWL